MRDRAPGEIAELADVARHRPRRIGERIDELAGGRRGLAEIGADRELLDEALDAMLQRPDLAG